jgi:hypothetical protein
MTIPTSQEGAQRPVSVYPGTADLALHTKSAPRLREPSWMPSCPRKKAETKRNTVVSRTSSSSSAKREAEKNTVVYNKVLRLATDTCRGEPHDPNTSRLSRRAPPPASLFRTPPPPLPVADCGAGVAFWGLGEGDKGLVRSAADLLILLRKEEAAAAV